MRPTHEAGAGALPYRRGRRLVEAAGCRAYRRAGAGGWPPNSARGGGNIRRRPRCPCWQTGELSQTTASHSTGSASQWQPRGSPISCRGRGCPDGRQEQRGLLHALGSGWGAARLHQRAVRPGDRPPPRAPARGGRVGRPGASLVTAAALMPLQFLARSPPYSRRARRPSASPVTVVVRLLADLRRRPDEGEEKRGRTQSEFESRPPVRLKHGFLLG
uniref:Uncharacterized protein n=1 Tax=Oryza punctata TaxID=4537 RepID=A0A0E0MHD4_ORYPU